MKKHCIRWLCLVLFLSGCGMQTEKEHTSSSTYEQTESATEKAPIRQDMDPLVIYICGIQSGILDEEGNIENNYGSMHMLGTASITGEMDAYKGNAFAQAVTAYSAETGVPVEIHFTAENINGEPALEALYQAKTMPDLLLVGKHSMYDYIQMVKEGLLLDFGPYVSEKTDDSEGYYTSVLRAGHIGGGQYALPILFNLNGMTTTKEYLRQIGAAAPAGEASYEELMQLFTQSCLAMRDNTSLAALAESGGGFVLGGDYIPSILLGAAIPNYFEKDALTCRVEEALLTDIFELKIVYDEQENAAIADWRTQPNFYPGAQGSKTGMLSMVGRDGYETMGIFLTGGRAGGTDVFSSLLTDLAFFHAMHEDAGQETVFCGIPTAAQAGTYSANVTFMALASADTAYPEEVAELAQYLMDYEFAPWYGFSVNQESTRQQLQNIQTTEVKLLPEAAWEGLLDAETIEAQTLYIQPLSEALTQQVQGMLDHIAGAAIPYAPLEMGMLWEACDQLRGGQSASAVAAWVTRELEAYQASPARVPFENISSLY